MEYLDLRWDEHVSEVKGKIWTVNLIWRSMLPYNLWRSIRLFAAEKARIYVGWILRKRVWNVKLDLKYVQMYTRVYVHESAYIHRISERKARMKTRVCWSMWYEMSDLFCCITAICLWCIHIDLGFLNIDYVADYVEKISSCWLIGWWFNEWIDEVISISLMYDWA